MPTQSIMLLFPRRGAAVTAAILCTALFAACTGPRTHRFDAAVHAPLDPDEPVDLYIGELSGPHEALAVIETDAASYVDDTVKQRQMDQLRAKARRLGANAVYDVQILPKRVKGFTVDERTPFPSWRQGRYELYFMRGTAVSVAGQEPGSFDELEPRGGWATDHHPIPPALSPTLQTIPGPGLRDKPQSQF